MESKPDIKINNFNIRRMCRTCLKESGEEMNEIFVNSQRGASAMTLYQILQQLSGNVQISLNDGLPEKICRNCTEKAYSSFNFKNSIEQSDSTLRTVLFKDAGNIKSDGPFEENPMNWIKTEIAFVDADPFVDEEADFNSSFDYGHNSSTPQPPNNFYQSSYEQDAAEESGSAESDNDDDESFELKPQSSGHAAIAYVKDDDGKYICQICNKKLIDKKGLNLHVRLHTGENLKRCNICNRGFIKNYHLRRHLQTHDKTATCQYCDVTFATRADLKTHVKETHADEQATQALQKTDKTATKTSGLIAMCKVCDRIYRRISTLRAHLNQHLVSTTFDEVDIKTKLFLFNPLEISLDTSSNQDLHQYLKRKIHDNECENFYQIVTPDGYEMQLSDSEPEDDSEAGQSTEDTKNFYTCSRCPKTFKRSRDSQTHMVLDHFQELQSFVDKCSICQKSFPNSFTLHKHLKTQCANKTKKLSCSVCSKKFMWLDSMAKHMEHEHPGAEKIKRHSCDVCGKTFSRSQHLQRHRKIHFLTEKFDCPVCQKKSYSRKDHLTAHMKRSCGFADNRDEKANHLCIYCGRSFTNSWNYSVHMRTHTGEKPFECDRCDKKYAQKSRLKEHIEIIHMKKRDFVCNICGAAFGSNNVLRGHLMIHQGIKTEKCDLCDKGFYTKSKLTKHMRTHTGEKNYECPICQAKFSTNYNMTAHVRNVHQKVRKQQPVQYDCPRYY